MKIKKLVVKNYKVFDHLELDFTDKNGQVLDTIVLAGLNGSGKTTVLELLRDLIDGNTPQNLREDTEFRLEIIIPIVDDAYREYHGQNDMGIYLSTKPYSDNFRILIFNYIKDISARDAFKDLGLLIGQTIIEDMKKAIKTFATTQIFYFYSNDKQELIEKRRLKNVSQFTFSAYNLIIRKTILGQIQEQVFDNPDQTPRSIFTKQVNNLNKIFKNLDVKSKLIQISDKDLIFESTNGQKIGFDDLSSGEKMLYFMGFTLNQLNPNDAIIMVDEPEDSLHPKWQQQIVRFFNNIGENNQVILATHSPHIIGSVNADEVFFLEIDENQIDVVHPKYTKGHSIDYILEVMGANPRNTIVINKIDAYLSLIRKGLSETEQGWALKAEIDAFNLDPNSEEMRRLDLSLKRFKAVGV